VKFRFSWGFGTRGFLGDGIGEFENLGFREILSGRKIDMLVITEEITKFTFRELDVVEKQIHSISSSTLHNGIT